MNITENEQKIDEAEKQVKTYYHGSNIHPNDLENGILNVSKSNYHFLEITCIFLSENPSDIFGRYIYYVNIDQNLLKIDGVDPHAFQYSKIIQNHEIIRCFDTETNSFIDIPRTHQIIDGIQPIKGKHSFEFTMDDLKINLRDAEERYGEIKGKGTLDEKEVILDINNIKKAMEKLKGDKE